MEAERKQEIEDALEDNEDSFRDALAHCNFSRSELRALLADSASKERVEALRDRLRNEGFNLTGEEMQDFIADELDKALGREDG